MRRVKSGILAGVSFLILLAVASSSALVAQTSKGFIVGNVTNPNGAAVSGATIRITNVATGTTRETAVQSDGAYRFDAVDPGTYVMA